MQRFIRAFEPGEHGFEFTAQRGDIAFGIHCGCWVLLARGDLRDMAGRVFCWHGTPGIEGEAKEDRHANAGGGKGKRPQAAPKQDERARWVWLDTAGNSPMRT